MQVFDARSGGSKGARRSRDRGAVAWDARNLFRRNAKLDVGFRARIVLYLVQPRPVALPGRLGLF